MAMKQRLDIHDFDERLHDAEQKIDAQNPISARNAQLIRQFEQYCFSEGLGKARVVKYLQSLKKLAEWFEKDFDKADKADVERVVNLLERSEYSAWTKHDYKVALKRFYLWLGGGEEYPPQVKWIKTTFKEKDAILPDQLLTEEEVMKVVEASDSLRDKAFIITLYESGARIGELGSLRIMDVAFEEGYTALMVKGKTGSRRIVVVAATPYLQAWIQNHPLRAKPEAPLWVNMGTVNRYEAMSYPALAKILKVAAKKAGLKKRVSPHKFRHSRATFLAGKLTEAQMNQIFGWKQGSEMPSIYVHLSGRDVDDAILGVYGLKKQTEEKPKLTPRICPRCKATNAYDARFCMKCGLALDVKAAFEMEEARTTADNIMNTLMKDEEFRKMLAKKLKEYNIPT
jgi:site-specific recombinase XerD/ribosomal protein L40E